MRTTRILYAVTSPVTAAAFLRGHLAEMRSEGHELHLAAAPEPAGLLADIAAKTGATVHAVAFSREIRLWQDLCALLSMIGVVCRVRPDLVNVGTPKAGLLGGLAALLCRVPARVYTLHGLRLETARGARRLLLWCIERVASACAHRVVCVSPGLRARAIDLNLVSPQKACVLGEGSFDGVDSARFARPAPGTGDTVRKRLGLAPESPVIGFVGRMTRDKGVPELLAAFEMVRAARPDAMLLLVGEEEPGDPLPTAALRALTGPQIIRTGQVGDTAPYYAAMSCLALPSHREGLGQVALEAAAAGLAVVASDTVGLRDAVVHGQTGLLVPPGNPEALAQALLALLADRPRAAALGQAGRARIERSFRPEALRAAWRDLYAELTT